VDGFHPLFLRENTWEAWDASSRQRLDNNIPPNVKVTRILSGDTASQEKLGDLVHLEFSDGHVGRFQVPPAATNLWSSDLPSWPRCEWGTSAQAVNSPAQLLSKLNPGGELRFSYKDMCSDCNPEEKKRWIEALHTQGIVVVENVPLKEKATVEFANSVAGYAYPTAYGIEFQVKAVDNPNNMAYTNAGLQMHTDLPFYSTPPGIQLFHCLQQAKQGGESLFLDAFDIASELYTTDRDAFDILSRTQLRFQDVTPQWHLSAKQPVIKICDEDATSGLQNHPKFERVCFNERTRDSWRDWSSDGTALNSLLYEALGKMERIVEDETRYVQLVLQPGEMVCIDNWRVMHSRGSFSGARHLQGCYLNWDSLYARWRAHAADERLSGRLWP